MEKERNKGINRKQEEEIRVFLEKVKQPDIDEKRKRQTLELLKMERKRLHVRVKKSYGKRLLEQMAYVSPTAWFFQGVLVLALGYLLCVEERDIALMCLIICAPTIGIVGFTEILRSYRQNMWELEQACRYNLRQLMGMRLLIFALMDSFVAGGALILGVRAGIEFGEMLLFFLIPQVLSDSVYLYLMTRFRRHFQGSALIASAIAMGFFYLHTAESIWENQTYLRGMSEPAVLLLLVLVSCGILAFSCMRFLKEMEIECSGI